MAHERIDSDKEPQALGNNAADDEPLVVINFSYHRTHHTFYFPANASISDLSDEVAKILYIPPENQKFMISKVGFLKPPFRDPELSLVSISRNKITLMGSTMEEVSSLSTASEEAARRVYRQTQPIQKVSAYKIRDWKKEQEESQYTFQNLRPLLHLPNPSRSLQFLQRLKDDAGIKAVMRKHKFTVPVLTEMDPIEHTASTHEGTSRTLGLNRNMGEIIELRLRTDAYDGYRDYKTIRKTLCHELTHNVHGPHNRDFWDLCSQIEKEVENADWRSGGRSVGGKDTYQQIDEIDNQGPSWTGGEYKLGTKSTHKPTPSSLSHQETSRSSLMANAAEERMKRTSEQESDRKSDGSNNHR